MRASVQGTSVGAFLTWRQNSGTHLRKRDVHYRRGFTDMASISGFMAGDGGLVCQYKEGMDNGSVLEVCNPLSKRESWVLPNPPRHSDASLGDALMTMVVDEVENSFTVFFIYKGFHRIYPPADELFGTDYESRRIWSSSYLSDSERVIMWIYESTTNQWRSAADPPLEHLRQSDFGLSVYGSSIMFQGLLYVVFSSYNLTRYWLYTYSIKEDVWEDTSVDFEWNAWSAGSLVSSQLIVSDNRLFLVSWVTDVNLPTESEFCCRLQIEEIMLADINPYLSLEFQMTGELLKLVFHLPKMDETEDREEWEERPWSRSAHGCPRNRSLWI